MMAQQPDSTPVFQSISWTGDHLRIIDQTLLPGREAYLDLQDADGVREAIRSLRVRGAPAIGIAAAYGVYLGVKTCAEDPPEVFERKLAGVCELLASSRPTAVNLQWALDQALATAQRMRGRPAGEILEALLNLAKTIHQDDKAICADIGMNGQDLVPENAQILTHCNTGSLATGQFGTALSIIYHAHIGGKNIHVWVDETRPLLQGSRLTSWELQKAGIDHHIITDSMAGWVMNRHRVDLIVVGTDRVAGNGDTANKIGTYSLAVLARHHNIPFYVAAPLSSIDLNTAAGSDIPIEERSPAEVRQTGGCQTAPDDAPVYNPAFDVTPHELITAFVTERGIIRPDYSRNLAAAFER
ncbi:S-methyl-5-thioribose-1-phosphate isomerase [Balneolales bacterium ANBcel1]|nr:S-methyl-5-thioribose-1-phosphate isomerase [Balneolales bacterium ANBcel1]